MTGDPKLRAEWFWTDRWFASSAISLPLEARGLYRELLTRAWSLDGKLPASCSGLRRLAGASTREWNRSWPLVKDYFVEQNGHLVNLTQLEILKEAKRRQAILTERARKAAKARWEQSSSTSPSNAQAYPQAMPEQCPPSPSQRDKETESFLDSNAETPGTGLPAPKRAGALPHHQKKPGPGDPCPCGKRKLGPHDGGLCWQCQAERRETLDEREQSD